MFLANFTACPFSLLHWDGDLVGGYLESVSISLYGKGGVIEVSSYLVSYNGTHIRIE